MLDLRSSQTHPRCLSWFGYAILVWSIAYMLPHLYWALGGEAGFALVRPSATALPEWRLINAIASAILTMAGSSGLAFVHFEKRPWLSALLLTVAWIGCALASSHGIYGIVDRALQILGLAALEGGPFNLNEHAYVFWDLVLLEPWFLIEGLLFAGVGWCYLSRPQMRHLWLVLCVLGIGAGLVSGLLEVRFA